MNTVNCLILLEHHLCPKNTQTAKFLQFFLIESWWFLFFKTLNKTLSSVIVSHRIGNLIKFTFTHCCSTFPSILPPQSDHFKLALSLCRNKPSTDSPEKLLRGILISLLLCFFSFYHLHTSSSSSLLPPGSVRRNSTANSRLNGLSANHRIADRDYMGWMDFGRRSAEEYEYSS